jgi:hypothetical protein
MKRPGGETITEVSKSTTRPSLRGVKRTSGVTAEKTRPAIGAVARRSDLEPVFGAHRRFELTRSSTGWDVTAAGHEVLRVTSRAGPFWKSLGKSKTGSPERVFEVFKANRLLALLRLDAIFIDPGTGQMERRGRGHLLDALGSALFSATLRRHFAVVGQLPHQTEPLVALGLGDGEILARAGERELATIFVLAQRKGLESLDHYELAFAKDSPSRERVWVAVMLILADAWCLEAERRRR